MQPLSRRVRLGIAAVAEIAGRPRTLVASMHDLAARFGMGQRYFEGLLRSLRDAGLIEGVRGRRGGFMLARPAAEISVLDIARALDPPADEPTPAALGYACAKFVAELDKISVADLRERAAGRAIESLAASLSFVCVLAALAGAWTATP